MPPDLMTLKILLPFHVFSEKTGVKRIVVETRGGSVGFLPHRLDCVSDLGAGILTYEDEEREVFIAVDEGVLIKTGLDVRVSVRNAVGGESLDKLKEAVERDFRTLDKHEENVRAVMEKMESGLIRRLVEFHRD